MPEPRPTFFASQRNRNAHQHVTRVALCGNLQEKVPQPRDVTQMVPAQDVKKKHACETSFKNGRGRCKNDAFVPDFPQKAKLASVTGRSFRGTDDQGTTTMTINQPSCQCQR